MELTKAEALGFYPGEATDEDLERRWVRRLSLIGLKVEGWSSQDIDAAIEDGIFRLKAVIHANMAFRAMENDPSRDARPGDEARAYEALDQTLVDLMVWPLTAADFQADFDVLGIEEEILAEMEAEEEEKGVAQ